MMQARRLGAMMMGRCDRLPGGVVSGATCPAILPHGRVRVMIVEGRNGGFLRVWNGRNDVCEVLCVRAHIRVGA